MEDNRVDLMTLPTADEAAQVRTRLQEAGLEAYLTAEEPLRIQVAEKDAETARQVLAAPVNPPAGAEVAGTLMDRAFKAAVLGLMVWPIEFYAFGLLARAFLDEKEELTPERERVLKTLIMSLPLILLQLFLVWTLISWALNYF